MPQKTPQKHAPKKVGKSLKEKREAKKAKKAGPSHSALDRTARVGVSNRVVNPSGRRHSRSRPAVT